MSADTKDHEHTFTPVAKMKDEEFSLLAAAKACELLS